MDVVNERENLKARQHRVEKENNKEHDLTKAMTSLEITEDRHFPSQLWWKVSPTIAKKEKKNIEKYSGVSITRTPSGNRNLFELWKIRVIETMLYKS